MGARIESAATAVRDRRGLAARNATRLSDGAARVCLERARRRGEDVDVVASAGVFTEQGVRPSLDGLPAADARKEAEGSQRRRGERGLAFDVPMGGCGALAAAHCVDGLLASGACRVGLVVAADAAVSSRSTSGLPFASVGGALLLSDGGDEEGFEGFEFRTFHDDAALFNLTRRREGGTQRGRYVVDVHEDPRFAARCLEHGRTVARGLIARAGLREGDVDLLIASQYPPGFARDLARELGIGADRVPRVDLERTPSHTAGPIAALEAAMHSGQFWRARHVLFITVGAGLTIGAALYRR
jgi:3-oxoacyl-[acyl-carrier-protein] synthase-3